MENVIINIVFLLLYFYLYYIDNYLQWAKPTPKRIPLLNSPKYSNEFPPKISEPM